MIARFQGLYSIRAPPSGVGTARRANSDYRGIIISLGTDSPTHDPVSPIQIVR